MQTIQVKTTSIDDFIAHRSDIDPKLVKIDAEGHDFEVLLGMRNTVAAHQTVILIECNSNELLELCAEWNYSIFAFTCDPATIKMTFRQLLSLEDLHNYWTKMLFLTPRHLLPAFLEYCS